MTLIRSDRLQKHWINVFLLIFFWLCVLPVSYAAFCAPKNHCRKYNSQYNHHSQWVQHRPHKSQCRSSVFSFKVSADQFCQQRPISHECIYILSHINLYFLNVLIPPQTLSLSDKIRSASVMPSGIGHSTPISGSFHNNPPSSFG